MGCIEFTVKIDPVPKGRPRFFRMGRRMGTYTPAKTRAFESELFDYCRRNKLIPATPLLGPVVVDLIFFIKSKHVGWAFRKPDLDNLCKTLDTFNGYFWKDDAQIVKLSASKVYDAVEGGIYIHVQELSDGLDTVDVSKTPKKT
ncbi:crossover junction endodeoxyribonuclease RusA [Gammaproteobacteria bacterium]